MATNNRNRNTRKTGLVQRTPEQTRKMMSDRVQRGVAVVTGIVEGFAHELKEGDLPGNAEQAVTLAGQTARRFAETGAYELAKTKRRVQAATRGIAERQGRSSRSAAMGSRGGRSSRSRAGNLKRRIGAKKGAIKRKLSRELPAIKRKVGAKKGAITRKFSGGQGSHSGSSS